MTTIAQQERQNPNLKITFRVSEPFRAELKIFAVKNRQTLEELCIEAVTQYMKSTKTEVRTRVS